MYAQLADELPLPPVLENSEFPVVRQVRLIGLTNPGENRIHRLSFAESQNALTALKIDSSAFTNAVKRAIETTEINNSRPTLVSPEIEGLELAPCEQRRYFQPIYDLEEIAFRLNGALVTMRASLNVKPTPAVDIVPLTQNLLATGNFGVQFSLLEHPQARNEERKPKNLSLDVLQEFEQQASLLAGRVFEEMKVPFQGLMQEAKAQKLDVKEGGLLTALMVATRDRDIAYLLTAMTEYREKYSDLMKKSAAADFVIKLAYKIINPEKAEPSAIDLKNFLYRDDLQVLLNDSSEGYEGITILVTGGNKARFIGLAQQLKHVWVGGGGEEEFDPPVRAADAVSGKLIENYVRALI